LLKIGICRLNWGGKLELTDVEEISSRVGEGSENMCSSLALVGRAGFGIGDRDNLLWG
jgi:hypothetical protein